MKMAPDFGAIFHLADNDMTLAVMPALVPSAMQTTIAVGFDDDHFLVDAVVFCIRRAAGRHGHGASDMFARFQRRDRLPAVIGDWRVDVDGIDVRVFEKVVEIGVARFDAERIAALVAVLALPWATTAGGALR